MGKITRFECPNGHGLTMRTDDGKREKGKDGKRMHRRYWCLVCGVKQSTVELPREEFEKVMALAAVGKKHLAETRYTAPPPVPLALPAPVTKEPNDPDDESTWSDEFRRYMEGPEGEWDDS